MWSHESERGHVTRPTGSCPGDADDDLRHEATAVLLRQNRRVDRTEWKRLLCECDHEPITPSRRFEIGRGFVEVKVTLE